MQNNSNYNLIPDVTWKLENVTVVFLVAESAHTSWYIMMVSSVGKAKSHMQDLASVSGR